MKNKHWLIYLILIFLSLLAIAPFIWTLYNSFILNDLDMNKGFLSLDKYGLDNYIYIFTRSKVLRWTLNSIFVTLTITIGNLVFNSMAGYALARFNFKGRKILFYYVLAIMMVPTQIILIPIFLQIANLNMINSYAGLIIPFLINPFGVFLMRQFYLDFPKAIEEAARIDGLSNFGVFSRIIIPLSKGPLMTQGILIFVWNWNSFTLPSIIVNSTDKFTLPLGIYQITNTQYIASVTKALSAMVLTLLPTIILYVLFQKYLTSSKATSGIK
jgi:multiple sugar transport system permease protein